MHSTSALKHGGWAERHDMNAGARHEGWFPTGGHACMVKHCKPPQILSDQNKSPSFCFLLHHWTGSTKARCQTSVPSIKSIHRPIIPQKSQQKSMIILKCYDPLRWPGGCLQYYSISVYLCYTVATYTCSVLNSTNGKEATFLPISYNGNYIYLPFTSIKQFPFN